MKIVKMKLGFWLIPEKYNHDKIKGFYWLWWNFITHSEIK